MSGAGRGGRADKGEDAGRPGDLQAEARGARRQALHDVQVPLHDRGTRRQLGVGGRREQDNAPGARAAALQARRAARAVERPDRRHEPRGAPTRRARICRQADRGRPRRAKAATGNHRPGLAEVCQRGGDTRTRRRPAAVQRRGDIPRQGEDKPPVLPQPLPRRRHKADIRHNLPLILRHGDTARPPNHLSTYQPNHLSN